MRRSLVLGCVAAFVFSPVLIADAGGEQVEGGGFMVPDPADCRVEPRPDEEGATAAASPDAAGPPDLGKFVAEGTPADYETAEAVVATVREFFACLNAGDGRRAAAHLGDDAARGFLALAVPPGFLASPLPGTPEPPRPEDRTAIRISEILALPDGRATAVVDGRAPGGEFRLFVLLARPTDRFVIEALVTSGPVDATPAA